MDYDKLIEDLKCRGLSNGSALGYHSGLYEEAATAIETLQIENQALRNAANGFKANLARVTAERDDARATLAWYKRHEIKED